MALETALVRHGRTRHGVLQALQRTGVAFADLGIAGVLAMVLHQGLKLDAAGIEHTGKIEGDIGRMVRMGLAEFAGPVIKQLPLVRSFFGNLDGFFVHIDRFKMRGRDTFDFRIRMHLRRAIP